MYPKNNDFEAVFAFCLIEFYRNVLFDMMTEKTCENCKETKSLDLFGTRGSERDRFGNPLYRGLCKKCDSEKSLAKYYKNKAANELKKQTKLELSRQEEASFPEYVPKAKAPEKFVTSDEDYSPWEKRKGRELTEEEKVELDSSVRILILQLLDDVIQENKGIYNEETYN